MAERRRRPPAPGARATATGRPAAPRPPRQYVLADSGPLLALFNAGDRWHAPVLNWLREHPQLRLVSTWPVLTEVCALLAHRVSHDAALDFLRWIDRGAIDVDRPESSTLAEVLAISERFADLPFDLADASIAEAAGRWQTRAIISIDADFDIYRDRRGKPLTNLLRTDVSKRRR